LDRLRGSQRGLKTGFDPSIVARKSLGNTLLAGNLLEGYSIAIMITISAGVD
jgi:hypothetical protein